MRKYKQLSTRERLVIHKEFKKGASIGAIARILGRNKSTISREIKRNGTIDESTNEMIYNPREAHKRYMERFKIKKLKIAARREETAVELVQARNLDGRGSSKRPRERDNSAAS